MADSLLTAAQMRAVEASAIAGGVAAGTELMERAGAAAVEAILDFRPELREPGRRATVLCGPGNNGGDGFVVARLLAERGWSLHVIAFGPPAPAAQGAAAARARWETTGGAAEHGGGGPPLDLFVDALFGTGLARPLGDVPDVLRDLPAGCLRVALDVPSGLCADSGRILGGGTGRVLRADLTVAFHAAKPGHHLADGPGACGRLVVAGIGLHGPEPGDPDIATLIDAPGPVGKTGGHKYDHGHALVLAGGIGRGGAARLAARAALRVGAGLVTLAPPPAAVPENAARLDAVMIHPVDDASSLANVLSDGRISAICAGPGFGTTDREAALLAAVLKDGRPVLLDADAITLLARDEALRRHLHEGCLLTPHDGEFERIVPAIADRLGAEPKIGPACSRIDAVREAAASLGCAVLLKGPGTVVADRHGRARIHSAAYDRAAPWLATAGAGDVLAGLAAGLMARGFGPADAGAGAAWLHCEAARAFGPGLTAADLPGLIPAALRSASGAARRPRMP